MALPVIPDVYRVSFKWGSSSVRMVSVINVRASASSEAAVLTRIETLAATWGLTGGNPWGVLPSTYNLQNITVLALDGVSAGISGLPSTVPHGGGSGEPIQQCALIMSWQTGIRGPKGRGRLFIGPITEDIQISGTIQTSTLVAMASNWNSFFNALQSGTPSIQPVVASYKHAVANDITNLIARTGTGTQKRRMDRVRVI